MESLVCGEMLKMVSWAANPGLEGEHRRDCSKTGFPSPALAQEYLETSRALEILGTDLFQARGGTVFLKRAPRFELENLLAMPCVHSRQEDWKRFNQTKSSCFCHWSPQVSYEEGKQACPI